MEFKIERFNNYYYVALNGLVYGNECFIAEYLDLTVEEYQNILISNSAFRPENHMFYYFRDQESVRKTIDTLEPYLIMAKLTR